MLEVILTITIVSVKKIDHLRGWIEKLLRPLRLAGTMELHSVRE